MKKILCLNGWGQEPKTLENAFKEVFKDVDFEIVTHPGKLQIISFDGYNKQRFIEYQSLIKSSHYLPPPSNNIY